MVGKLGKCKKARWQRKAEKQKRHVKVLSLGVGEPVRLIYATPTFLA